MLEKGHVPYFLKYDPMSDCEALLLYTASYHVNALTRPVKGFLEAGYLSRLSTLCLSVVFLDRLEPK